MTKDSANQFTVVDLMNKMQVGNYKKLQSIGYREADSGDGSGERRTTGGVYSF